MTRAESVCWRSYKLPQRLEGCGSKLVCGTARARHVELGSAIAPRDRGDEAGALPLKGLLGAGPPAPLPPNQEQQTQHKAKSLFLAATGKNPGILAFVQKRFASRWKHLIALAPLTGTSVAVPRHPYPGITWGKSSKGAPRGRAGGCRGADPNICIHKSLILKVLLSCYQETILSPWWHCNQPAWPTEIRLYQP